MAQTIKLKRSATSGATPTTSQLELGEVAINTYDGKMYIKKNVGGTESIVEITGGSGGSSTLGGLSDVTISSVAADQLLQYNGSEWVNVSIAEASAIMKEYQFTATAGQSTFSGSDDNSETLSYTAGAIQVFLNGIFLDSAIDYTATNGTSVVLSETVDANDYLQVVAFKKKIGDGNVSVDTFTGNNSTTAFTLSVDPGDENNTRVFIDGVYQSKDNYSVSGTTLTFSTPPPTDTAIEIEIGNRVVTLDTLSDLDLPDNVKLRLGTSQDLEIFHDGTRSIINDAGTGDLQFQVGGSAIFDVTTDGIVMEGFPESAYELKGDIDGGIRFTVQAGEALSKGDVVYISGAAGDNTVVSKAQANSASTMPAFGLVLADIANGGSGQVVTFGNLYGSGSAALDTSTCSVGDSLYVSATTAGAFTKTAPTGESNLVQNIGKVLRVATSNGVIKVGGAGRTNATPNLDDGDIFIGNASNQAVSASLNTKIESYLDGGTSTASFASLTFDNYTLDSNKISTNQASGYNGDIFLDAAGDIILDADGGDVRLKDNGTEYLNFYAGTIERTGSLIFDVSGNITLNADGSTISLNDDTINFGQFYNNASGQFNIYAPTQDKDIVFLGNDGGSTVTALTLDMSDGGTAILASHLDMGDNQKIRLGDSDDLQLFHDGSNSYIQNGTTGNINITNTAGGEFVLVGVANGGTFLYHDGTSKFQTTSTGVDVTGTADADNVSITSTAPTLVFNRTDRTADNKRIRLAHDGQDFRIQLFNDAENAVTNAIGVNRTGMTLDSIAFYEDTGTTAKLFWDASAERLGIGTTSPDSKLTVNVTSNSDGIELQSSETKIATLSRTAVGGQVVASLDGVASRPIHIGGIVNEDVILANAGGNVGIGTSSPAKTLHVVDTSNGNTTTPALFQNSGGLGSAVELRLVPTPYPNDIGSTARWSAIRAINSDVGNATDLAFLTNDISADPTERMRIDSSGNVGIGTTSPAFITGSGLEVQRDGVATLRLEDTGSSGKALELSIDDATGAIINSGSSGLPMIFKVINSEAMRINTSGNVGIGETSPDSKLHVKDATNISASAAGAGQFRVEGNGYTTSIAMDATRAHIYHNSSLRNLSFGTDESIDMTIKGSNGFVGIGTENPASLLSIQGDGVVSRMDGTANTSRTLLFRSVGTAEGIVQTDGNMHLLQEDAGRYMRFSTANTERMRIDSSGNLLVSKTGTGIGTVGVEAKADGQLWATRDGNPVLSLHRKTSDGSIAVFYKDGSTVGSIGTTAGRLYIGDGDVALRFADDLDFIAPWNASTNAARDNAIDLGNSGNRFKDLYLSGKTYLNTSSGAQLVLQTDATRGFVGTSTSHALVLETAGTERARFDSSGNLLVATTNTLPQTATDGGGLCYAANSSLRIARESNGTGQPILDLNNTGSDDELIRLRKDGTVVGSIGSYLGGYTYIGSTGGTDTHIGFVNGTVRPATATGATLDATLDLGNSSARWKDLYLSGNAYIGNAVTAGTDGSVSLVLEGVQHIFRKGSAGSYAEFGRFDTSGNLLVGKTNNTLSNDGTIIRAGGEILVTNTSDIVANFNRTGTDGSIVTLYKDGTTVGSIGSKDGDLFIGTDDTRLRFVDANDKVYPVNASGNARDNAIDLGNTNARFKDLYLAGDVIAPNIVASNGVFLGGTSNANKLDDYEEGTFTATFPSGVTSPTYVIQDGSYVKIGKLVTFQIRIELSAGTANSSHIKIGGLPFTSTNASSYGGAFFNYSQGFITDIGARTMHIGANGTLISFYKTDGNSLAGTEVDDITGTILINGQYEVA